ncbi:MAG: NAD(P)/FAD-dependent oxidoreductase [Alphaproteobacteria bacterium]
MTETADVLIIGAGVVGCAIANSLSQAGLQTLNIDALPAAGYGSTSHSTAIIRPFYSHITSCAVAHESRYRWLNWPDFLRADDPRSLAEYHETGGLVLVREGEESKYANNLDVLDTVGVDYQLLDEARLVALYPNICLDSFAPPKRLDDDQFGVPASGRITGGIYLPACGHVSDPQLAAHNLLTAATAYGGQFRFDARIVEILQKADKVQGVVLASGEQIHAPAVVNAAGPHSASINQLAGIEEQLAIATRPHRHEVAYLRKPATHSTAASGFFVDLDTGVYQRGDGADLLIGSADPACDPEDIVDPDDYNTAFTEQWTLQAYRAALRFPDLQIESKARGTVGLYDVSDDWIPIYDKSDLDGFYLAIGTSGNQFKNAPIIGDIMVAIILAGHGGIDHDATPQLLGLAHLNRSVDLSFYSRKREVQATRTVLA